jgi:hypothetical protein
VADNGRTDMMEVFEPLLDSQQAGELMHLHPESVKRLAGQGRSLPRRWAECGVFGCLR